MMLWKERPARTVVVAVFAIAAVCALLLALPGQTVVAKYVNDLFIFLDGAHRVMEGQVPNRDFRTALGPLNYYIPAAGYLLSGNFGGAMPFGLALVVLGLAIPMAHVLSSRVRPSVAVPFAAFVLLIAAVPINLGEGVTSLTYGMFYNRLGWSALAILLVMYLQPYRPRARQDLLDAVSAAFLTLFMLYLKASYGVIAAGFLIFMLIVSRQRRWAALALGLTLATGLVIEAFWGGTAGHIADLRLASAVSGGFNQGDTQGQLQSQLDSFLRNLADYVLFVLFAGLALWRTRSIRDLLFYGFCAVSGFLLFRQNYQGWGIIALAAAAAVAAETILRQEDLVHRRQQWVGSGASLLLLAFVLPTIVHCTAALGIHAALAASGRTQGFGLPNFDRIRLANLWLTYDHEFFTKYLSSLQSGARLLAEIEPKASKVFVLDFVSAFSASLGLAPSQGDNTWYHFGRNLNDVHFVPPEEALRDVRIVMEPKWAVEGGTLYGLRQIYGPYIAENFHVKHDDEDWKIHVRRDPSAVAAEPAKTAR